MLPFQVQVYDQDYVSRGPLGAPASLTGEVTFNAPGSAEIVVPAGHKRIADLTAPGARVSIHYTMPSPRVFMLSGRVEAVDGGGGPRAWRRFRVVDDFSVLTDEVQCWPVPAAAITAQSDAYHTVTGPAETVLKSILAPNVTRQGTVLTIPATAGLGSASTASVRFHTVAERVLPLVDGAGLGVRVRQSGATRTLDVWQPATYPRPLTEGSGVVISGEYTIEAPTVTRVVVGAGGEGAARVFRQYVDTALESTWGIVLPAFRDARDIDTDNPDLEALMQARADETFAEGAPVASLRCELVETSAFRLGIAYNVGDIVSVQLAGGAPLITDRVRSVAFEWTAAGGAVITPRIGEWSDTSDDVMVRRVLALTRATSDLQKGR